MKKIITLTALTLFAGAFLSARAAPNYDLAGRVHYSKIPIDYTDDAPPVLDGAVVELYRMTPTGWALFDSTTTGSEQHPYAGFYIFENIDCGGGAGTLFEYADWCKVKVDATGKIPNWPEGKSYVRERYVFNDPQPAGIYAGKLRRDVVYFDEWVTPVEEPAEPDFGFRGRFVCLDGEGNPYTPDPNTDPTSPPPHEGRCPPGAAPLSVSGCLDGDFWDNKKKHPYPIWEDAGWVFFKFYQYTDPPSVDKTKLGEGYFYWDPACPYWALHRAGSGGRPFIVPDLVDIAYPE